MQEVEIKQFQKHSPTMAVDRARGLYPINMPIGFYDTELRSWFLKCVKRVATELVEADKKPEDFVTKMLIGSEVAFDMVMDTVNDPSIPYNSAQLTIVPFDEKWDIRLTVAIRDKDAGEFDIETTLHTFQMQW